MWIALIHGANGLMYFVHEWKPSFREDAVFRYPDTVEEITLINAQIKNLASILNTPTLTGRVHVEAPVEISTMVKFHGKAHYVFAVNMEKKATRAHFTLSQVPGDHALVLGEDRIVPFEIAVFRDEIPEYGVRLYEFPFRADVSFPGGFGG